MNKALIAESLAIYGADKGNRAPDLRIAKEGGLTNHQTHSESPPGCQAINPWL